MLTITFAPLAKMLERLENSKQDSDSAYFYDLLYLGEMLTKTIVLGMASGVIDDKERNRYRLFHRLVRADGIGEWGAVLDEMLTGVASQYLNSDVRANELKELNQKNENDSWQFDSVEQLIKAVSFSGIWVDVKKNTSKIQLKTWFSYFAMLRNGTRGHGAPLPSNCSQACIPLEKSILLFINNFYLFKREWVYLYQNLNGKYRISKLSEVSSHFNELKSNTALQSKYENGLYVYFEKITKVELMDSSPEVGDFYYPNGNFKEKSFEMISYISSLKKDGDSSKYLIPANELPLSETEGLGNLEVIGNCFSNIPPLSDKYVHREVLESELYRVLIDEGRYPIITLKGLGGIGKTSLALSVLHNIAETCQRFSLIIWFSSRDIDLTTDGAKHVKNKILNETDISNEFMTLLDIRGLKTNERTERLHQEMTRSSNGPTLFVFDNFETVKNPIELFTWIDTYIRLPNKVLITSRTSKNFKADYPIEVSGMTFDESEKLIKKIAEEFEINALLAPNHIEKIIQESNGHPYVIRIYLGEIAKNKKVGEIKRIVASKDDILTALFRRTFNWLSPAAKRVFLTLCSWRSIIPQIAIEAVLLREENERINVEDAIEELRKSSFIEVTNSDKDIEVFITVPLAAAIFGKSELEVSSEKYAILADRLLLQDFGVVQPSNNTNNISPRINDKFRSVKNRIKKGEKLDTHLPTLEYIAYKYPVAWLTLAEMHQENKDTRMVIQAYEAFLKSDIEDKKDEVWQKLADCYQLQSEWFKEVSALVEKCSLPNCTISTISEVANKVNQYFQQVYLNIDSDIKQSLIRPLAELMHAKINKEASATDLSRLAWLYLHLKDRDKAREITERGLLIDEVNKHCVNLKAQLSVEI